MKFYYNPEVHYLLLAQTDEKEAMVYNHNPHSWEVPMIGLRPPYYCYPRYEPYYPTI